MVFQIQIISIINPFPHSILPPSVYSSFIPSCSMAPSLHIYILYIFTAISNLYLCMAQNLSMLIPTRLQIEAEQNNTSRVTHIYPFNSSFVHSLFINLSNHSVIRQFIYSFIQKLFHSCDFIHFSTISIHIFICTNFASSRFRSLHLLL